MQGRSDQRMVGIAETHSDIVLSPIAVDRPPHFSAWVLVLKARWQSAGPDRVVTMERGKPWNRRWKADGRKAWMTRRGKWPAVIHCRRNRDAGRHFVV